VRAKSPNEPGPADLRRAIERLDALPMRPSSARQVLAVALDEDPDSPSLLAQLPPSTATDPAWAIELSRSVGKRLDPLSTLAEHRWWPTSASVGPIAGALARLWRHSTAVSFAARRLARDAGDPDPEAVARAGLLHGLGLWALASVSPEAFVAWTEATDSSSCRELERKWLGVEASSLGRALAVRWGCEPLVADAAWLHADLDADLNVCSDQPARLTLIQQAYAMASTTPWAPGAEQARDSGPIDPRVRMLTAEVQARCGGSFVEADSSTREERLTRDNARLRVDHRRLIAAQGSNERFLRAFVESSPDVGPAVWAERAGLAWCGEPGVAAARVVWTGLDEPEDLGESPRPPSNIIPLGDPSQPHAQVHLWAETSLVPTLCVGMPSCTLCVPRGAAPGDTDAERRGRHSHAERGNELRGPSTEPVAPWDAWARQVAERDRLARQLDGVVSAHRGRVAREEPTRRRLMLDALAEFAAGAGHELNNPLAVIVGRAQLLLAKEDDPDATRSLRAIIAQAQRAARILRDLMYVARPPEPRPRPCQPEEIVRACLRDLQADAEARGVKIVADSRDSGLRVWADPEPLRQIADILARNALEASSSGGLVQFTASGDDRAVRWTVHDNGRGIGATEGLHLFDPFYCGRSAGRGLGLGLPRAARIVAQAGGDLKWQSSPGLGTTFIVTLPVSEIPASPEEERPGGPKSDRALPVR
jgi:signal transduction histidine kinase